MPLNDGSGSFLRAVCRLPASRRLLRRSRRRRPLLPRRPRPRRLLARALLPARAPVPAPARARRRVPLRTLASPMSSVRPLFPGCLCARSDHCIVSPCSGHRRALPAVGVAAALYHGAAAETQVSVFAGRAMIVCESGSHCCAPWFSCLGQAAFADVRGDRRGDRGAELPDHAARSHPLQAKEIPAIGALKAARLLSSRLLGGYVSQFISTTKKLLQFKENHRPAFYGRYQPKYTAWSLSVAPSPLFGGARGRAGGILAVLLCACACCGHASADADPALLCSAVVACCRVMLKSTTVGPRRPLAQDAKLQMKYDEDSDEEWGESESRCRVPICDRPKLVLRIRCMPTLLIRAVTIRR